ncbi:MAG: hypothetical protein HY274_09225 [Gammaproteobacteria bacterium]|nr:hypothetical protein [Gammaproteobacteria bacterium]
MTNSKYVSGMRRLPTMWIASALVLFVLGYDSALADSDTSLDDSAKKIGNNFGQMLKGMGQEVKKVVNTDDSAQKKDNNKKEKKRKRKETEKDKEK